MKESEILAKFAEAAGDNDTLAEVHSDIEKVDTGLLDPEVISVLGFFDSSDDEKNDKDYHDKVKKIIDFAKEGASDKADLLWNIRTIEGKLGNPPFGINRVEHLYNYIVIKQQANAKEREAAAMER